MLGNISQLILHAQNRTKQFRSTFWFVCDRHSHILSILTKHTFIRSSMAHTQTHTHGRARAKTTHRSKRRPQRSRQWKRAETTDRTQQKPPRNASVSCSVRISTDLLMLRLREIDVHAFNIGAYIRNARRAHTSKNRTQAKQCERQRAERETTRSRINVSIHEHTGVHTCQRAERMFVTFMQSLHSTRKWKTSCACVCLCRREIPCARNVQRQEKQKERETKHDRQADWCTRHGERVTDAFGWRSVPLRPASAHCIDHMTNHTHPCRKIQLRERKCPFGGRLLLLSFSTTCIIIHTQRIYRWCFICLNLFPSSGYAVRHIQWLSLPIVLHVVGSNILLIRTDLRG